VSLGAPTVESLLGFWQHFEHCLGSELSHGMEAPDQFMLRIQWDSEEGLSRGFRGSAQFETVLKAVQRVEKEIEE
jgi:hypothetical protein